MAGPLHPGYRRGVSEVFAGQTDRVGEVFLCVCPSMLK